MRRGLGGCMIRRSMIACRSGHAPATLSVVDAEIMHLLALARTRDVCPETAKRQEEYRKWRQGFPIARISRPD